MWVRTLSGAVCEEILGGRETWLMWRGWGGWNGRGWTRKWRGVEGAFDHVQINWLEFACVHACVRACGCVCMCASRKMSLWGYFWFWGDSDRGTVGGRMCEVGRSV